ncbi:redox-sensing transcriptional repressor Rex [Propionigenium maris DSM 9537]|uniref:Redox-sensing transcriptional repressor Rex n=1 Tax=Propionigenium maris DSM 9537 TaxID=1123000 RepID=A0A9W6GJ88_9FUSO|nr:redox-sensing transcriptional repressor Rex [Propionigenium maris]GLI54672.1 redox-sensing transcriptional repressor Rex [Propionigenium maris DSM 9537]
MKKEFQKNFSPKVIERLTEYLRYLEECPEENYISAEKIGKELKISSPQIRKDFSYFISRDVEKLGVTGKGYHTQYLCEKIKMILGVHKTNNVVLLGAGSLGSAFLSEYHLAKKKFNVIGVFDSSPKKIGKKINGVVVKNMNELDSFIKLSEKVDIILLTSIPADIEEFLNTITLKGVKAILNFTTHNFNFLKDIAVISVDIYGKLQELNYWKNHGIA